MGSPVKENNLAERMDEVFSLPNQMGSRMSRLEESVNRPVGSMMPKVEALLSGRRNEDVPTSSSSSLSPSTDSVTSTSTSVSTSLLEMAERGDGEGILQILAERHTDVGDLQRTENGDTALHVAARRGHLKAVMALLGGGVKLDAHGHRLRTPLHCAAAHGHLRVVERLLDMGAEIDAKDASGTTALELAVEEGNWHVVAMLLQKRAQPSNEVAFEIVSEGHCNIVELFLLNGVPADLCNAEGDTLLVQAAKAERWNMVELLLKRGASATKCIYVNECALRYAAEGGQTDAVRLLLRHGAASDSEQVKEALGYAKNAPVVWAFVDFVPDAVRGQAGKWGLTGAAVQGRLETLVALLDAGVDIEARTDGSETALIAAASVGRVACVEKLLGRGAVINAKDWKGDTPLHKACMGDKVECVRALLAAGASTTERNEAGKTPLEVAVSDAVRLLFNT